MSPTGLLRCFRWISLRLFLLMSAGGVGINSWGVDGRGQELDRKMQKEESGGAGFLRNDCELRHVHMERNVHQSYC